MSKQRDLPPMSDANASANPPAERSSDAGRDQNSSPELSEDDIIRWLVEHGYHQAVYWLRWEISGNRSAKMMFDSWRERAEAEQRGHVEPDLPARVEAFSRGVSKDERNHVLGERSVY